jgi:putative isomerase
MKAASIVAQACNNTEILAEYQPRIDSLAQAIETYCWDPRDQSYYSVDVQCRPNREKNHHFGTLNVGLDAFWGGLRIKVLTWMSALPFWAGLGTDDQFEAFLRNNLTPERLWSDHGIRSLSKDEPMYAPEIGRGNPSNWLGPIWLVANYIIWEMLKQRGRSALASQLAENVTTMLDEDLAANGKFHEYYSPETGLGVNAPGFMSWNALAALMEG